MKRLFILILAIGVFGFRLLAESSLGEEDVGEDVDAETRVVTVNRPGAPSDYIKDRYHIVGGGRR